MDCRALYALSAEKVSSMAAEEQKEAGVGPESLVELWDLLRSLHTELTDLASKLPPSARSEEAQIRLQNIAVNEYDG